MGAPLRTYASITAFIWSLTGTTTLIVHLRLLLRWKLRCFGTEDILMALAWACVLTTTALFQERLREGFHPVAGETFSPEAIYASATAQACLLYACGLLAKGSVGLLLLRLIGRTSRVQRVLIIGTWAGVYVPATVLAMISFAAPPCDDALAPTQPRLPGGSCMSNSTAWMAFGQCWNFASAAIDILYSLIATAVIAKLQLSRRKKAGLIVALSLGYMTAILATWRAVGVWVYNAEARLALNLIAITLEANLVLICGSVVTLSPLLEFVRTGRIGSGRSRSSGAGATPARTKVKRLHTSRTNANDILESDVEMLRPGQAEWRSEDGHWAPVERDAATKDNHFHIEHATEIGTAL